jgi:hypothetical protein
MDRSDLKSCNGESPMHEVIVEQEEFSPYLEENTTHHHYRDQLVNAA